MKNILPLLLLLLPLAHAAEEGWVWKPPEIKAEPLKKPAPKIDGDLDDEAWKDAAVTENFLLTDGRKPKGHTKLYVLRDETTLYIALECFETEENLKKLVAKAANHDQDEVYGDDCVELFLDPSGKRATYYQLAANFKGVTWDAYHESASSPDKTWEPKYACAAKMGKTGWSIEFAFPLAIFNREKVSADAWAFNVSRSRHTVNEHVYFSPVYNDSSHTPENFGLLLGMPKK
ncbi:MAG: hypothetical protein HY291_11050 [Planctomycetes bacterium]|nr:hypothetical protein [Planctomycetota bacterium]